MTNLLAHSKANTEDRFVTLYVIYLNFVGIPFSECVCARVGKCV